MPYWMVGREKQANKSHQENKETCAASTVPLDQEQVFFHYSVYAVVTELQEYSKLSWIFTLE